MDKLMDINLTLSFLAAKVKQEIASVIFFLMPPEFKIKILKIKIIISVSRKKSYLGTETEEKFLIWILIKMSMVNQSLLTCLFCDILWLEVSFD